MDQEQYPDSLRTKGAFQVIEIDPEAWVNPVEAEPQAELLNRVEDTGALPGRPADVGGQKHVILRPGRA